MTLKGPRREVRQTRQSIHCTHYENEKSLEWSKDKRFDRPPAQKRTLIEVCCSDNSLLCNDRFRSEFSNVVRITEKDDFTTQSGLEKVIAAIMDPDAGRVTLWFATPCTWGTQARIRNKYKQTNYVERSCELFDQFLKLLQNEIVCMTLCVLRGGDIIKEWPDTNYQWKIKPVFTCLGMFNLIPIRFNGCAIGLKTKKGEPIKKPWCLMTTVPQVVDAFHDKRCHCPKGTDHPELFGAEAADSSHYTDRMCNMVHSALEARAANKQYKYETWLDAVVAASDEIVRDDPVYEIIPDDFTDVSDDENDRCPTPALKRKTQKKTAHLRMNDFDKEMLQDQLMCIRRLLEAGFYDRDEYEICVSQAINVESVCATTAEEDWRWYE
jgi:hypothetical protein